MGIRIFSIQFIYIDTIIDMELFKDGPISDKECVKVDNRYNGTYSY